MGKTLDPDGSEPEEKPAPEQSGAEQPTEQDKSESAGQHFIRGMVEGAGTVLGTTLASAVIIGLTAVGGVVSPKRKAARTRKVGPQYPAPRNSGMREPSGSKVWSPTGRFSHARMCSPGCWVRVQRVFPDPCMRHHSSACHTFHRLLSYVKSPVGQPYIRAPSGLPERLRLPRFPDPRTDRLRTPGRGSTAPTATTRTPALPPWGTSTCSWSAARSTGISSTSPATPPRSARRAGRC